MWLGIHAPERVDRLALLCTSPRMGPPEMWRDRAALVREQGPEAIVDTTLQRWLTDAYRRPARDQLAAGVLHRHRRRGVRGLLPRHPHMDLAPDLDRISAPTLVIAGRKDPATPPDEHAKKIAEGIPGARLVSSPGAHLTNVAHPDLSAPAVEHLDEATRTRPA